MVAILLVQAFHMIAKLFGWHLTPLNEPPEVAQGVVLLLEPSVSRRGDTGCLKCAYCYVYNRVVMRSGAELKEAVAVTRWPDLGMPAGSHVVRWCSLYHRGRKTSARSPLNSVCAVFNKASPRSCGPDTCL